MQLVQCVQAAVNGGQRVAVGADHALPAVTSRGPETAVAVISDGPGPYPAVTGAGSANNLGVKACEFGGVHGLTVAVRPGVS